MKGIDFYCGSMTPCPGDIERLAKPMSDWMTAHFPGFCKSISQHPVLTITVFITLYALAIIISPNEQARW